VLKGFGFQVPATTPDWAVNQFKISKNPLVEILPAMAFAGAGAINSLWYSDWVLGKGMGLAKTYEGDRPGMPIEDLKALDRSVLDRVAQWYRVMFHDNLWAGNFLTILVTAAFMINAIVILNPQKLAGQRMEPPVSVPRAKMPMSAARAAPEPPDEPPGTRSRSQGLCVGP